MDGWRGVTHSSDVSATCDSSDSMPERSCSRDREIWASWLVEGRFSDMARWRSSNDSLMWSDSRNNCGGLVAMAMGEVWRARGGRGGALKVRVWSEAGMTKAAGADGCTGGELIATLAGKHQQSTSNACTKMALVEWSSAPLRTTSLSGVVARRQWILGPLTAWMGDRSCTLLGPDHFRAAPGPSSTAAVLLLHNPREPHQRPHAPCRIGKHASIPANVPLLLVYIL